MKIRIIMPKDFYKSSKNKNLYPVKVVVHRKNKTFTAIRYKKINTEKETKKTKNMKNFKEISDSFINSKKIKGKKVKKLPESMYGIMKFKRDYNLVYDYSKDEEKVAQWLSDNIGGSIYLCPRVELPKNIKTPDYIWDNEKWDLKDINKHSKNTINTAINNTKKQSNNVILNLIDTTYTDKDLTIEMKRIYSNSRYNYINKIIVLQGFVLRKVYKRA
ncbi:hypothetical protein [uncultured Anaerococcus sp.]|uniref:CdiA C-terminal domain-containing protein n=1 Tax=uncultured Anaerococcus sp. TaxID=293428 RepID=UPI0028891E6D|nr:hypothetical protein [uncultured Anaerococcus sp.]